MVRIINGEIVQDNDPRLKNQGIPSNDVRSRRINRISSLNSADNDSDENQSQNNTPQNQQPVQNESENPFMLAAKVLKIENVFITIPSIKQVGIITETRVNLIYFIIIGIFFMMFGYKALLFAAGLFFMYKQGTK